MPCTSSCSAAATTSSTERLWPRWITSAPLACRMRRMMLIAASCPSKSEAAVTKRILFLALYSVCREALRSVMAASASPDLAVGRERLLDVNVNVKQWLRTDISVARLECRGPQSQRIHDHRNRARAHRRGGDHRVEQESRPWEQHPRSDRYAQRVVHEAEQQVWADVPQGGS